MSGTGSIRPLIEFFLNLNIGIAVALLITYLAEIIFKIKYKQDVRKCTNSIINGIMLAFIGLMLYKAFNPYTLETIIVAALLTVQAIKCLRELINQFIFKGEKN